LIPFLAFPLDVLSRLEEGWVFCSLGLLRDRHIRVRYLGSFFFDNRSCSPPWLFLAPTRLYSFTVLELKGVTADVPVSLRFLNLSLRRIYRLARTRPPDYFFFNPAAQPAHAYLRTKPRNPAGYPRVLTFFDSCYFFSATPNKLTLQSGWSTPSL